MEIQTVSRWEKFFNITKYVARVTNIIALGACAVTIGFQIFRDFAEGAPVAVKVLDIAQACIVGLQFVVEIAGLFLESACVPILGAVLAVVGLVMTFVGLFIHRDPPKPKPNPADIFISNTARDFLSGLKSPSQQWLDKYHKTHDKKKSKKADDTALVHTSSIASTLAWLPALKAAM